MAPFQQLIHTLTLQYTTSPHFNHTILPAGFTAPHNHKSHSKSSSSPHHKKSPTQNQPTCKHSEHKKNSYIGHDNVLGLDVPVRDTSVLQVLNGFC
jgi:hypothetical protein